MRRDSYLKLLMTRPTDRKVIDTTPKSAPNGAATKRYFYKNAQTKLPSPKLTLSFAQRGPDPRDGNRCPNKMTHKNTERDILMKLHVYRVDVQRIHSAFAECCRLCRQHHGGRERGCYRENEHNNPPFKGDCCDKRTRRTPRSS